MKKVVAIAVIILISISTLFRGLFFDYETYGFLAALALLSIIYFLIKIIKHESLRINKLFISVGVLLLAAICFSYAGAMNRRETLEALLLYLELLIIFIVLYDSFYEEKKQFIQTLMLPVVLTGVVAGFVGMLALTGKFNVWQVTVRNSRVETVFQYANTASVYFLICFVFALTLANTYRNRILKSLMTGFGSILIFAFFLTGSRGGYIVGAFALLMLFAIQPGAMKLSIIIGIFCSSVPVFTVMKGFNAGVSVGDNFETGKWIVLSFVLSTVMYFIISLINNKAVKDVEVRMGKWVGITFIALAMISVIAVTIFKDNIIQLLPPIMVKRIELLFTDGLKSKNFLYRLIYNHDALKLIASHWLFGIGSNGWKALYQSVQDFFYTSSYVHNHFFQVFVDHGIIGFASYTVLVIITVASAIYSYIRAVDRLLKSCAAGLLCAFIALVIHSALDFNLSYVSILLLLWVMIVAAAIDPPAQEAVNGDENGEVEHSRLTGVIGFAQNTRWKTVLSGNIGKLLFVGVGSLLFSMFTLYFTSAYNGQTAMNYMLKRDYKNAMVYYEEANRLDPSNTAYIFELTKIYHYYGRKSTDTDTAAAWLEKAREAGELCVSGYKNYPAYMNTLVRIYLDSDMPLEALELAQKLTVCQKYNAVVYELLAKSYFDAAQYYIDRNDTAKAKEMLEMCLEIDSDPYLRGSVVDRPEELGSVEVLESYSHSKVLAGYLEKAENMLANFK